MNADNMDKEHGEEPARLVTDEASHFGHHRRSVVFKVLKTVALIIVWVCIVSRHLQDSPICMYHKLILFIYVMA